MLIRNVKPSDVPEMYDKFRETSVTARDIAQGQRPSSGFYEYNLPFEEFEARSLSDSSLVCLDRGQVTSYLLALPISEVKKLLESGIRDPVFERISGLDSDVMYFDQLLVQRGMPSQAFAARVLQTGERLAQNMGSPGAIGATALRPWSNIASKRLIRSQGFLQQEELSQNDFTLGIYTKPYWPIDTPFEGFGDSQVIPN